MISTRRLDRKNFRAKNFNRPGYRLQTTFARKSLLSRPTALQPHGSATLKLVGSIWLGHVIFEHRPFIDDFRAKKAPSGRHRLLPTFARKSPLSHPLSAARVLAVPGLVDP